MKYLLLFLLPLMCWAQEGEGELIPNTDPRRVFGSPNRRPVHEVQLTPGLYQAQERDGEESFYVVVQQFINDRSKRLVLMVPRNVLTGSKVGHGWIFQSRPVREGGALMFSPLSLDSAGNIVVNSEDERDAQVALLTRKSGKNHRNPYILEGRNGGLDGKVMELSKVKYQYYRPVLKRRPSMDIFKGFCPNQSQLAVTSKMVSIHDGDAIDLSFQMLEVNGQYGEFSALARSRFDSMSEADVTYEDYERFATFYKLTEMFGEWSEDDDERFLMAIPDGKDGLYRFEVYARAKEEKNILERVLDFITGQEDE